MAKKQFNISKLTGSQPKRVIKKSTPTPSKAVAAIHKGKPIRTSLDIPSDVHKRLKIHAIETGLSMKDLIIQFINEGIGDV